jgi:hypothetical protein
MQYSNYRVNKLLELIGDVPGEILRPGALLKAL